MLTSAIARSLRRPALGLRQLSGVVDPTLGLDDEQAEFYHAAKAFADAELAPHAAQWDREKEFPRDALRAAAELGFGGVFVKDDVGGSGLTRKDGLAIFEALASADTSTTAYLSIHNMVAGLVDRFGSDELRQRLLPDIVSMEHFTSYCLTEPGAGSDAASLTTKAERDGDEYVLNGAKAFISGGGTSDYYLVMCRTGADGPRGISAVMVPAEAEGLSASTNINKVGWNSQRTSAIFLDNVRVPVANRVGDEGQGFKIAMAGLDGGRLSIGTCSVGAAAACLDLAVEHLHMRKQFGKPLADNQALRFDVADMATRLQSSRLLLRHAARLLDDQHPDATAACAMAKRAATDAGFRICDDAMQLHGGYGYTGDVAVERFWRDCRVHRILEGTNQIMSVLVSRAVLDQ